MWYENNVFIATVALLIIALAVVFRIPEKADTMVIPIITAIAAFVTGYATHAIQNAVTTKSTVTKEDISNAETPKVE